MIDKTTVTIPDTSGQDNHVKVEINAFSDDNVVRLTLAGKTSIVDIKDLYSLALLLGTPEQQERMLSFNKVKLHKYSRQHKVKTTKALKKGDEIVVNCEIDVDATVSEAMRNGLLTPVNPI